LGPDPAVQTWFADFFSGTAQNSIKLILKSQHNNHCLLTLQLIQIDLARNLQVYIQRIPYSESLYLLPSVEFDIYSCNTGNYCNLYWHNISIFEEHCHMLDLHSYFPNPNVAISWQFFCRICTTTAYVILLNIIHVHT